MNNLAIRTQPRRSDYPAYHQRLKLSFADRQLSTFSVHGKKRTKLQSEYSDLSQNLT